MTFSALNAMYNDCNSFNIFYLDRCNQNKNKIIKNRYNLMPTNEIKPIIKNILKNTIDKYRYHTIAPYTIDIETVALDTIYTIKADDVPFIKTFLDACQENNVQEVTEDIIQDMATNMCIINYTTTSDRIIGFTSYNPFNLFKGKNMFVFEDTQKIVEFKQNVISVPNYFDCIYIKSLNQILILKKNNFETMFKYTEEYQKMAKKALEEIKTKSIIQGKELSSFSCINKNRSLKKLSKILLEHKVDTVLANFSDLVTTNDRLPETNRVKIDRGLKKIIIDDDATEAYIEKVLSLLNLEPYENMITHACSMISDPRNKQLTLLR